MACPRSTGNRDYARLGLHSGGSTQEFSHNDENLADSKKSGGRNLEIGVGFFNGICPLQSFVTGNFHVFNSEGKVCKRSILD